MNQQAEPARLMCSRCDRDIDSCEFCDEPECPSAICGRCVDLALGQAIAQPHGHGG
ncbi:MAG TPA: hypothetical protein VEM93_02790 [Actinomycetota bacterium]|nr:hypothetical protein [Actinomycetota bacterium]